MHEGMERRTLLRLMASTPALCGLPLLTGCGGGSGASAGQDPGAGVGGGAQAALPGTDALTHLLRRTRFATTAADLAAAQELGPEGYLDSQLQAPAPTNFVYLQADARYPLTALPPPLNVVGALILDQMSRQLSERTLFLAAYSDAQLYELVVDFWTNHFNIENVTGNLPLHKLYDDRNVIRAHAFGRFPELLLASAQSPAMLEYLDNVSNVASGPNENYARELMELHTLGVDGGYTEQDVVEVARCFTGWGINGGSRTFQFQAANHDDGEKVVLGEVIPPGGGVRDGERVIEILAAHPSTARFVATKLARRFVADAPPPALVDAVAAEYARTQGDIRAMLRVLLSAPEFYAARNTKVRRPLEYVAQLLRSAGPASAYDGAAMFEALSRMGQIPHRWFPPDGFPDRADYWLNTAVLLEYWNLAATTAETSGLFGDATFPVQDYDASGVEELIDAMAAALLQRPLRPADADLLAGLARAALPAEGAAPTQAQANLVAGLLLASPYFMLR